MGNKEATAEAPVKGDPTQVAAKQLKAIEPVMTPAKAKNVYTKYQQLLEAVISDGDVVAIAGKKHPTKQFANKLARMFALSVEIVQADKEDGVTDTGAKYFVWHIVARATAPNGQFRDGDGHCATNERTFNKYHHDVYATAVTRAKNRAILELVGMGEVSYEEIAATQHEKRQVKDAELPEVSMD